MTKKDGIIFAAHVISDGCLLDEGFNRGNISVKEYIEKGLLDGETFAAKSEPKDLFELVRKEDVDELMSVFPGQKASLCCLRRMCASYAGSSGCHGGRDISAVYEISSFYL